MPAWAAVVSKARAAKTVENVGIMSFQQKSRSKGCGTLFEMLGLAFIRSRASDYVYSSPTRETPRA